MSLSRSLVEMSDTLLSHSLNTDPMSSDLSTPSFTACCSESKLISLKFSSGLICLLYSKKQGR